jgi:hypothetical protein
MPGERDAVGHGQQTSRPVLHQTELEVGEDVVELVPVLVRDQAVEHKLRPRLRVDLIHDVAKVWVFGVRDYCELVSVQVIPLTGTICSGTRPSTRTLQSGALEFLRDVPMLLRIREDRVNDARQRLESIDEFRGFSILLMVLADYLAGPHVVPAWLKHAPA